MIVDELLEFCDALAIPAAGTALIGDVIDLQVPRDVGAGQDSYWYVALEEAAAGGTSIQFQLLTSAAANMGSPTVLAQSAVIATADLGNSRYPVFMGLPAEGSAYQRYLGLRVVVVGTYTTGKITSGLTNDKSAYRNYPEGQN